ncbi:CBN-THOC-2 protein [Caenorhabditis brenneri]|uniref:THO complex subunit 2 n=1 Tax=Caenorhabditis brenneri TaxID=135651 RepID=G0N2V1_CAEBE|nr:CBN-THOC-2 protein [Caenorhabditis brenneri]
MEMFETLTQLCLDIVHMKISPAEAFERILTEKKDRDALSSELMDVLVLTEPESEFAENASTSKANFESFVNLLTNTIIPEEILRLELDCLKKDDHNKAIIRLKTKIYFKQAKFNLFREESEGYSKLITELMEASESSPHSDHPKIVKNRVLSLIGQFNLDPNRVTDCILEVFESFPRQKHFFISLLKQIDVVPEYLCAILGFKYTFHQTDKKKTPYSLYVLTAYLIQYEMIDLMKILAYMIPKAEAIKEGHRARMTNANERASKAETISTASIPLLDSRGYEENGNGERGGGGGTTSTISFTTVIQLQEDEDTKLSEGFNEESVLASNQKLGLACALLENGNWKQAQLLIDRLPEYYAVQASPRLCRALCQIIERAIDEFYRKNCSLNIFGDASKPRKSSDEQEGEETGNGLKPVESWEELGKLASVLWYLGPRLAYRATTNIKILRLLTNYYQKIEKGELQRDEKLNETFVEVVSECLLPSLTLSETNVSLSEELWQLLQLFPYSWRYWMYSKWNHETARHPEMHIMKGKIHGRTKYVLKRLSKETVKMMGRQLGKLCHIHPSTVLSYLLSQVQTFDNFIGPVVDSLRYLTSLEFDVLTYCIISQLADPSKQALKSTDATISPWLQALGTLVGSLYRRYPLELNGMLDYVLNQLKLCKSYDMLLLREIIQNMSWIESISGATKDQIEALGGGDLLKQEAGGYSTATKNRKAAQRLRDALLKGDLAVGLCISIAQQKEHIIYNESATLPLKLVGKMVDQCSDTFQQLVSFLSVYMRSEDFAKRVPTVRELLSEYSLGMEATMCLARPTFFSRILDTYDAAKRVSKAALEDKARLDSQQKTEMFTNALEQQVEELMKELREIRPQIEDTVPLRFFAVFWMLTMYDIEVPVSAYDRTIESLKKQSSREDSHSKGNKKTDKQLESKLKEELKRQTEHVERCKTWLLNRKDSLIDEKFHNSVLEVLIQQCLLPRAIFSELDAVFCGQFFLMLHEMRTPFFPTIYIIDRCFENTINLIAGLTENEANALACFYEILLVTVQRWHSDEKIFEKECAGFPGMITKSAIEYQTFRKLCYRWQNRFQTMFKLVLTKEDTNYTLIRNSLIMMTKLTSGFPVLSHAVETMEQIATKLKEREKGKRDDLSLKAASYVGRLKMRQVKIFAQNSDFAQVANKKVVEKIQKKKEPAEGEPVDKKAKIEKTTKNGNGGTEKVKEAVEQNGGGGAGVTTKVEERKKRPVKTSSSTSAASTKDSKKDGDDGEVSSKTPSPPPAKKTRIGDRLKRPDEDSKDSKDPKDPKDPKEHSDSEKGDKKRREKSRERKEGKEKKREEKERKSKENNGEKEAKKEEKKKERDRIKEQVAGPALPEPPTKKDDKRTSSSRGGSSKNEKRGGDEPPKAARIAEPIREKSRGGERDRGDRNGGSHRKNY